MGSESISVLIEQRVAAGEGVLPAETLWVPQTQENDHWEFCLKYSLLFPLFRNKGFGEDETSGARTSDDTKLGSIEYGMVISIVFSVIHRCCDDTELDYVAIN